jgi:hypothetical protein
MSITNPVLSDKAKEMFAQGLGQENLDAFLAADVKDFAVDVLEINGGNEAVASALQIGAQLTVEELATRFETAVAGITADEELANEAAAVAAAPAPGLTPAQEAANKKAAQSAAAAGSGGTEVSTTSQSPAPTPAPVEVAPAAEEVADLQAEVAETETPVATTGLVEPQWISQLSASGMMFKGAFDKYVSDMRPKLPVEPAAAARNQVLLVRTLCGIINNLEGNEFHTVFNYVLQQFVAHREGSLRDIAIFRAIDENQLSIEQGKLFPRLINLLILAADPDTRDIGLRQVDLQKTLAGELITEAGRRKVFQYFGK